MSPARPSEGANSRADGPRRSPEGAPASVAHRHDLTPFVHDHRFHDAGAGGRARALWQVTWITAFAMVAELAVGWWSGSLALVADGWHMGTHALALGGAALAMRLAQRARSSTRFAFGGWKIEMLSAWTSGLMLLAVSIALVVESVTVLREPRPIAYVEAMWIAGFGLAVNLLCAWRLSSPGHDHDHDHGHDHDHDHGHDHHHADQNFRAALLHVIADAFTSVLAIAALAGGLWQGWRWLDPLVALVGALVIGRWAVGVLAATAPALVDASSDRALVQRLRQAIESDGDAQLTDLHVWQVGPKAWAAILSVVADRPQPPQSYSDRLRDIAALRHVTIEVHRCPDPPRASGP